MLQACKAGQATGAAHPPQGWRAAPLGMRHALTVLSVVAVHSRPRRASRAMCCTGASPLTRHCEGPSASCVCHRHEGLGFRFRLQAAARLLQGCTRLAHTVPARPGNTQDKKTRR